MQKSEFLCPSDGASDDVAVGREVRTPSRWARPVGCWRPIVDWFSSVGGSLGEFLGVVWCWFVFPVTGYFVVRAGLPVRDRWVAEVR